MVSIRNNLASKNIVQDKLQNRRNKALKNKYKRAIDKLSTKTRLKLLLKIEKYLDII
jgi:hypothetical protein